MSEVEKMYENAGIKPLPTCNNCNMLDEYWSNGTYCSTCKYDKDNDECNIANYTYPPFTAEKQLELIKWLIQKNFYDERIIRSNFEKTYFYCSYIDDYCESTYFEKFEEALANVFNYFWQDLTETERNEIRDILRG